MKKILLGISVLAVVLAVSTGLPVKENAGHGETLGKASTKYVQEGHGETL